MAAAVPMIGIGLIRRIAKRLPPARAMRRLRLGRVCGLRVMSVAISPALLKEVALILADCTTVLPASGRLAARPLPVLNCGASCKQEQTPGMLPFLHLKWPEMRPVAHELIARMHEGHAHSRFTIPVVDFVLVFAAQAHESELTKLRARGALTFTKDASDGGTFTLAPGARTLLDLHREGLSIRVPARLAGRYTIMTRAFRIRSEEH